MAVTVKLSRKRRRELKKLRNSAENLWEEQRDTLEHAAGVLRDARRQLSGIAQEEVYPRVRSGYSDRVKPVIATGLATGRSAIRETRRGIADEVVPAISGAIGSALAVVGTARDPRVREAVRQAGAVNKDLSRKARTAIAPRKAGPGPATYILIGLGVLAAAGTAYAVWQTLRSDDELWVEDLGPAEVDLDDDF